MALMLVLREEIVCICILILIQLYSRTYLKDDSLEEYSWLSHLAMLYLLEEVGAVALLNSGLPQWISRAVYGLAGLTEILFCGVLADVAVGESISKKLWKNAETAVLSAATVTILISPFLPMETVEAGELKFGLWGTAALGKLFSFTIAALALAGALYKRPEFRLREFGIPIALTAITLTTVGQIFFPQSLFIGAAETVAVLLVFLSMVSVTAGYRQKAYMDETVSIKNKNCYTRDLEIVEKQLREHPGWTAACISADMDFLKKINDNYGHSMGDAYLRQASQIMQDGLKGAYGVYRTGGDEFVAIYVNTAQRVVERDLQSVRTLVQEAQCECPIQLTISLGCAWRQEGETAAQVIREADRLMYQEKRNNHAQREDSL